MKISFKQHIFFYFLLFFSVFMVTLVIFEQIREKNYKSNLVEENLKNYTRIINSYIIDEHILSNPVEFKNLTKLLPPEIRITIIDKKGEVLYDNDIHEIEKLENHLTRPEIQKSIYLGEGINVRRSASTQADYMYYAKSFQKYFIRVALPYNIETEKLFKADNYFIYISILLFIVGLVLLNFIANKFNNSILKLKNIVKDVKEEKELPKDIHFPDDDLGEIGAQLIDIFEQKEKSKQQIELEREKLILHFQYAEEGVAIFNSDNKVVYTNSYFIQYLNLILDEPVLDVNSIFEHEIFIPVKNLVSKAEKYYSEQVKTNKKVFLIQAVIFDDQSFEISIKDITKIEKTRLIKQEMTNNITHELRTPVSSIRAYLETLEENNLSKEKQEQFINRAYLQSIRLSHLIDDISIISKIEEAGNQFKKEPINVYQLINEVRINLTDGLTRKNIKLNISVNPHLILNANYTLLFSIFQNLIENSINYGGDTIEIFIDNYMEDSEYLYFSYYDTGKGVENKHLGRLFERFYRVNEGRTRNSGGTGLGLSIVKNAVLLHQGNIQAKIHKLGGLEFLFTLKK